MKKRISQIIIVSLFGLLLFCVSDFCIEKKEVTIYFIRHGQTDTNVSGLLVGTSGNPVLTETGEEMARELGVSLQNVSFDAAYSSPLQRAADTAALVLAGANQEETEIIQIDELKDIFWGDAEGMSVEEMEKSLGISSADEAFGDIWDQDFISPIHAETRYDFCVRFEEGIEEIVENAEDGDIILVVAHSSMDYYFEKYFPDVAGTGVDNCSVTIMQYDCGGAVELIDYNDVSYLN